MFTDTPKLQPISTSRNNDKKVPSNNGNNNHNGVNNIASKITTNACSSKTDFNKNIGDTSKVEFKDSSSTINEKRDNRCNYGSYRSNNYQNQNCPKNYKNREFNEYYTNSFTSSNNYNSYKRWSDWDKTNSNTNFNSWNSNHRNNNNYRNNYKYSENTYKERESSFAEDSFHYNSFNNDISKTKETDHNKYKTTSTTTTTTTTTNTKLFSNYKNNQRTINNKQFKPVKNKGNFYGKYTRENSKTQNSFKTIQNTEETSTNKELNKSESPSKSTDEKVIESEIDLETNKPKATLNEPPTNELIENNQQLESESLTFDKDNIKEIDNDNDNLSAIALDKQTEEDIFNSKSPENTLSETNSTETTTCNITNELCPNEILSNENSDEPKAVLENSTSTLDQEPTTATSPQATPHNTSATSESENFEFHTPKISLIPISRLLAAEFWESNCNDSLVVDNVGKQPNTPQKTIYKPNLIKRKRNVSTCSNSSTSSQTNSATDRIVEKLVTMNKINIKNIINSSETKYDEALKIQARKRLREEIRRQLKSMNIEPPKDPICPDFVPDEIVDSIDIPDVVFDEIRKALGLELFPFSKDDNLKVIGEMVTAANGEENVNPDVVSLVEETNGVSLLTTENSLEQTVIAGPIMEVEEMLQQEAKPPTPPPAPPTPPKIKYEIKTENITSNRHTSEKNKTPESRSKSKKLIKRKESRKSKKHRSPKKPKEDVVVLISSSSSESSSTSSSSSSSSSTSSSSSSSSSDSESDASEKSSTSLAKRKRLKLKVDAENVVDSFEKLILSSLSESLKERYRTKYSTSINTKLHFISCICTSDYNSGKFSKLQIAKVQKNLKSSDCSMALEFLMKEIVNVFNKQKQVAKMEDGNKCSKRLENSPRKEYAKDATHKTSNENNTKEKCSNGKISTTTTNAIKTKSANAAEKVELAATNGEKHIQQCVSKILSLYRQEMKAAMQANEMKNQPSFTQKPSATVENQTKSPQQQQTSMESSSSSPSRTASNNEDKNAGPAKHNEDEAHLENPINCLNQEQEKKQQQQQQHQTIQQQSVTRQRDNELIQQTTGSLEKLQQCYDIAEEKISTQIIPIHSFCSSDYSSSNMPTSLNGNLSILGLSSTSFNQHPSFPIVDLEELKKQSPIGEVVVNNLREIDVKLMELHKRKMYLEEMILKLQKDKMEADLLTIKLQNEKFILLNTAMTANVTSTALKNSNIENIKSSTKEQQTNFSTLTNIKTETTTTKDINNVVTEKQEEDTHKKNFKVRPTNKSSNAKRNSIAVTKRKIPPTVTASEIPKKRCKPNKSSLVTKTSSKNSTTQKSTKIITNKTTAESKLQNSIKSTDTDTSTKSSIENSTKVSKDLSPPPLPPPTAPSPAPPDPSASSQPPALPPPKLTENNKPQVDVTKSSNKKSLYKNMPTGSFEGIRNPITQIRIFEEFIVASSEDGKLYKFDVNTLKLLIQFAKHTEAITQMYLCPERKVIYTTSLDGYLKKSSLENFALDLQSIYLQEPLQSIDIQWDIAYIGSRWGNIYTYNVATNSLTEKPLCSTDSSIISIKATKEGVRKILIVSSKGNLIHLRDATSGLLLRTFDVPESINIYSILLNDGIIYCGTQKREIRKYDFVSGEYLGVMTCGNGAVSMQIYNNRYILVGCYDGFIYILDKTNGKQVGRLAGSGKMILTLEIIEDKIITSAKDNTMKVTDIPSYCLKNNKTT